MIPEGLQWLGRAHPDGAAWLAELPDVLAECKQRWSLSVGDPYPGSFVSLVMPATDADGGEAVLKIQFPHPECEHEAAALEVWDGGGVVRLLEHAPEMHALLLERCTPGTHLSASDPHEALTVLIGLLPRLWKPASAPFGSLAEEAQAWARGLPRQWERAGEPFERELVDTAVDLLRSLAESQPEQVLLHQDLHADNVLAARREPWLVIDPKPLVGERAFAVAPIVRSNELGHGRDHVLHRLDRLTDELGLDRDRARGWTIGQTLAWAIEGSQTFERHVETARWLVESR
ncbi:MAG: aminoglycoside phosphotransferase family protein [Acidimicrobiia bacterium]